MITHANLAWKNLAHIVEFGFTGARPRAGLWSALPRRRARPHHDLADRGRSHDHHPSSLRRGRRGRRARAIAGDHRVAGAGHGQRHHGVARHRAARSVVGAGGHQRRREDADPAHRADPAHLPSAWFADAYGLTETVSGDTFLDRDSLVSKLGSVGRPCLYLELDIWDERGHRCRRGSAGRSSCGARRCSRATGGTPRRRPPPSPEDGSTPGTSASATRTATSSSSIGSRT